jgi:hypothetical protein
MTRTINPIQTAIAIAITSLATANAQSIRMQVNPQTAVTVAAGTYAITSAYATTGEGLPQKDELLAGTEKFAQGATSVTEINLDPTTLGMMNTRGRDADLAKKMTLMVVHTYAYDKPGMYRQEDVDAFRKKLEDGSWSCYVHVKSQSGSSDICSRAGADHETNEMVIFSARAQKLTFIHLSGKMSLTELSEMSERTGGIAPHEFTAMPMPPMIIRGPKVKYGDAPAPSAQPAPAPTPAPSPTPPQ